MSIEILPDQRSVLVDGQERSLGARAFDVLHFLADHADRVVSKEELLNLLRGPVIVRRGATPPEGASDDG